MRAIPAEPTWQILTADLASSQARWWKAARVGAVTAVGAALTASLQLTNPLGLTLIYNFAAPESAFGFSEAIVFLAGAAVAQSIAVLLSALVDLPSVHFMIFALLAIVTSYLIYAAPWLGRLWVWAQVPSLTAFYLSVLEPEKIGQIDADIFGGLVVAVALLMIVNRFLWPVAAETSLARALQAGVDQSRLRLQLLARIWLAEAPISADRPVASRLGHHIQLLKRPGSTSASLARQAMLVAGVLADEQIHNRMDLLAIVAKERGGGESAAAHRAAILAAVGAIDRSMEAFSDWITAAADRASDGLARSARVNTAIADARENLRAAPGEFSATLAGLCDVLEIHSDEHPGHRLFSEPSEIAQVPPPRGPNRFLVRYSLRHSIAMAMAFIFGLADNSAALHAALWLLMIGGPPSHGATARKFTVRAIGSAAALTFASLATIVVAPNFTSPLPYAVAIFAVICAMAYIGQGGGLLSYLSIGGTAFMIAFSGAGPRDDIVGSVWTIWGITFGMILRAAVSVVWRERASRTLVEQFQNPLGALLAIVQNPRDSNRADAVLVAHQARITASICELLTIANDAQLEGRSAGIDPERLVDVLASVRRITFLLGNTTPENKGADLASLETRLLRWTEHLRMEEMRGCPSLTPLRDMVAASSGAGPGSDMADDHESRLPSLTRELEQNLQRVSLH